jgi:hypothetical protein
MKEAGWVYATSWLEEAGIADKNIIRKLKINKRIDYTLQ